LYNLLQAFNLDTAGLFNSKHHRFALDDTMKPARAVLGGGSKHSGWCWIESGNGWRGCVFRGLWREEELVIVIGYILNISIYIAADTLYYLSVVCKHGINIL
jgi:hypothetical protein